MADQRSTAAAALPGDQRGGAGVVVRLQQVSKVYGSGENRVLALDGVCLDVRRGEYLAVMGESGSGKSTAMNIMGCLDRPSSGEYWLEGQRTSALGDDALADLRNRKLGFVFQNFHLLGELSALENVVLPMIYAGVPPARRRERAQAALVQMGLGERLHNRPNQLSGGQQQRVAIARSIVNRPTLLLADEPTGALDSQTTSTILDVFGGLHEAGMTVVMVTHEDNVAERAQRIVRFGDGQLLDTAVVDRAR